MRPSILAQTTTTITRLVQYQDPSKCSPRLAVSKAYADVRGTRTKEEAVQIVNNLRETLLSLRHPNLVTLRSVDTSSNAVIHLTSDFLENAGDLHNILQTRLRSGVYLSEREVLRIFVSMALGVKYLHDNFVCHGLLHPRNVLVQQSPGGGGLTVRLTDFGAGHLCGGEIAQPPNPRASYRPSPSSEPSMSLASDMWSLGIMLYEMVGLTVPFLGNHLEELERRQLAGAIPPLPSGARCCPEVLDLISSLLNNNPRARPDINYVLGTPLMQNYTQLLVASIASTAAPTATQSLKAEETAPAPPVVRVKRRSSLSTTAENENRISMGGRHVRNEVRTNMQTNDNRCVNHARGTTMGQGREANVTMSEVATKETERTEEERQLVRLRRAREEAHRERLALQLKYQNKSSTSQQSPPPVTDATDQTDATDATDATASIRSLGNVQRSPRSASQSPPKLQIHVENIDKNVTFTPPKPQIGNVQRSPQNRTPSTDMARSSMPVAFPASTSAVVAVATTSVHVISSPALRRRQSHDNAEHLERLRRARIETHQERMKLQEKMMGMGGRPVRRKSSFDSFTNIPGAYASPSLSVAAAPSTSKNNSLNSAAVNHLPLPTTDSPIHSSRSINRRKSNGSSGLGTKREEQEEAAYLESLRRARIENHRERIALRQRMDGMGGRPTSSPDPRPFQQDSARDTLNSNIATMPTHLTPSDRRARKEELRAAKEREHLEQLKQVRIEAHRERVALRQKMQGGSGGSGGGTLPTSPRASPAVAAAAARGEAARENRKNVVASRNSGGRGKSMNEEEIYLEKLRVARMVAFEERGFSTRKPKQVQQVQQVTSSGGTSADVLRRKSLQRDKKQAEHEELLRAARRVAFEERKALEAKMRNGGRTPGR